MPMHTPWNSSGCTQSYMTQHTFLNVRQLIKQGTWPGHSDVLYRWSCPMMWKSQSHAEPSPPANTSILLIVWTYAFFWSFTHFNQFTSELPQCPCHHFVGHCQFCQFCFEPERDDIWSYPAILANQKGFCHRQKHYRLALSTQLQSFLIWPWSNNPWSWVASKFWEIKYGPAAFHDWARQWARSYPRVQLWRQTRDSPDKRKQLSCWVPRSTEPWGCDSPQPQNAKACPFRWCPTDNPSVSLRASKPPWWARHTWWSVGWGAGDPWWRWWHIQTTISASICQ